MPGPGGIPEIPSLFQDSEVPKMLRVTFRNPKDRMLGIQVFHSSLVEIKEDTYLAASIDPKGSISFLLGKPNVRNATFRTALLEDWLTCRVEIVKQAKHTLEIPNPIPIQECHHILLSKIQAARNALRRQRYAIRLAKQRKENSNDSGR